MPEIMEMDCTYDYNIKIPLMFMYGLAPKSICNHHLYNWYGLLIRDNALNQFKDPLEACTVADGLNQELIPHLTFHSIEYACSKAHEGEKFAGYKRFEVSIALQRCIIFWNSIEIAFDIFRCRWISIRLVPTRLCRIVVNVKIWHQGLSVWYWTFHQICAVFHAKSRASREGDKCHQFQRAKTHLNKAATHTFIPDGEISFDKGSICSKSNYNPVIQYNNSKLDKYRINFLILANELGGNNFKSLIVQ